MAASIRSSLESSSFDLAGHDATSIQSITHDAFSTPFPPLDQMIRITFVVGAGKLSRQKYDAKAMQILTAALRELDYVEDRGAGCSFDCAGCFKTQHDTGKNLFTVVVFPKVSGGGNASNSASGDANEEEEPLLPTNSPGYKIAVCSISTFQSLLSSQCPTYAQKRKCMECIEGLVELLQSIENKLMGGHPLDSAEQSLYDEMDELTEKLAYTQKEAAKHVDEGFLTVQEKEMLVEMNQTRIVTLMKEKSSAAVAEKLKKALARKEYLQRLTDEKLSSLSSTYPPPLRHEGKLTPLRKKLLPLQVLEGKAKGGFLTLAETRALTEKEEIESEIEHLEEASYGWFEEEDSFEERLQKSRDKFNAKYAKKSGGKASAKKTSSSGRSGGGGNSVNKWVLPGQKQQGSSAWGTAGGKKKGGKGGAVFSAMMMDDSSSDDEEEFAEKEAPTIPVRAVAAKTSNKVEKNNSSHPGSANFIKGKGSQAASKSNTTSSSSNNNNNAPQVESTAAQKSKSKNKSKKKKKKAKQSQSNDAVEGEDKNEEDNEGNSGNASVIKAVDEATISNSLNMFWQSFLRPFLAFIISCLVSLVSGLMGGKDSKKGGKKKRR
jgi:hypothetical protein